ncbi:hypothetical protein Q4561_02075 [Alteromonas sp. 1_MG-2023]|uniref:hypothetical protein n=1 Tax=Alteromonas sp. 1_MG-2023 TaxID=3062669 RepID=UPI0026E46208|nr:hypothetical protein [Alteromonas sp. 1_MG-2023]MDO6565835.1 hypothetical protein [Alteromonas sp. 1_MG-2023]
MHNLIEHACQSAYNKGKSDKRNIDGRIIDKIFQNDNAFLKRKSDLMTAYSRLYHLTTKLSDTENRLSKFDLKERLRFFMFRVLTAIGIAAVILGTAIIAKELGVSLPLSSLKSG